MSIAAPAGEALLAAAPAGDADTEAGPGDPRRLNALVVPAGPALVPYQDGYRQRLIAPSLLGALAVMAQAELSTNSRVIRCRNEKRGRLVVVFSYQSRYCSPRCRYATVKRVMRSRAKDRNKKPRKW